jgi:hypothetical protein
VGAFFVNTGNGRVATRAQLADGGLVDELGKPVEPWHPIQGPSDASTMWYAVLRKRERGVFIGTLVLRHSSRHASLLQGGWQEVDVEEIRASAQAM